MSSTNGSVFVLVKKQHVVKWNSPSTPSLQSNESGTLALGFMMKALLNQVPMTDTCSFSRSGKDFTDFDKAKFTIRTKSGKAVSVQADRCGGDVSYAMVSDAAGKELFRHSMPDEEDKSNVSVLEAKYPGAMPYFFSQDPDYATVKERVAKLCLTGEEAKEVATIDIAIAALEVGEYLTPLMTKELS